MKYKCEKCMPGTSTEIGDKNIEVTFHACIDGFLLEIHDILIKEDKSESAFINIDRCLFCGRNLSKKIEEE